jgi:nitroimidazol reductase NimA-like FMN-containing flavoprotein (pyridoxamine 5'-phosphate oxidase superfamily)
MIHPEYGKTYERMKLVSRMLRDEFAMLITQLTTEECRELLARTGLGHLGCARNNEPYVVPIYFAYETDYLYGFSTFGRKIEWMRASPKVCVEVEEIASHDSWASVIITGQYQELPNTAEHNSERSHAYTLLEQRTLWWQIAKAAGELRTTQPLPMIFYRIHIDAISGHRAAHDDPIEFPKGRLR